MSDLAALRKLKEFSLSILKFIITREGIIQPMAEKFLLTVSRLGMT